MKDEFEMPMDVLVDTMDDSSRKLFSDLPSPVFVIDKEGIVRDKFPWPDQEQIAESIEKIRQADASQTSDLVGLMILRGCMFVVPALAGI